MTKETTEKITSVENMTKEKMAETIKTAKRKTESSEKKDAVSVCDIMKNNTSKVIKKMESQVPIHMQLFSDLYMKYLHSLDDLYGTCYMSEKEFFDKLPIDKGVLQVWDGYLKTWTQFVLSQIDMSTNFIRSYVEVRKSTVDSYDRYMHLWMESYAQYLSQFNSFMNRYTRETK